MNINIYEDYKVNHKAEYNRLSEENSTKFDNIFVKENIDEAYEAPGSRLLHIIGEKLMSNDLVEFTIVGHELHFEYFDPTNGENISECITIVESVPFKGSTD